MAEEQRFQDLPLCANNCGFFGSPATLNLCSKCYLDLRLKEEQSSSAMLAVEKTLNAFPCSSAPNPSSPSAAASSSAEPDAAAAAMMDEAVVAAAEARAGRCGTCQRRVGLAWFRCRCGLTFCGRHRYPEKHGCAFDYKAAGREAIAKANPLVVAEKLNKI